MHLFKSFWGFIILSMGVLLLLNTTGITPWNVWTYAWQFWPFLLIVFGIAFFLNYRGISFFLGLIMYLFLFGLLALGLYATWQNEYFYSEEFISKSKNDLTQEEISNEIPKSIEKAEIQLDLGASKLTIGALEEESNLFYKGDHTSNFFSLSQNLKVVGSEAKLNIKTTPFIKRIFAPKAVNDVNLSFSKKLDYDFVVDTGASDINMNFEKLSVRRVELNTGAAKCEMKLGKSENISVEIKAGASLFQIYVPENSSLRIDSNSTLVSNNFGNLDLEQDDSIWQSADWNEADQKINIKIGAGVSQIEIIKY